MGLAMAGGLVSLTGAGGSNPPYGGLTRFLLHYESFEMDGKQ